MPTFTAKNKSKPIKILTVTIPLILLLLIIALGIFSAHKDVCTTAFCSKLAINLKNSMNENVNPCDDFYEFACGNIQNDKSRKSFLIELKEEVNRSLLEIYNEEVKHDDHKIVKLEKTLFKECMNEVKIEEDGLKSIKKVIEEIGGWPALEGSKSSALTYEGFDWMRSVYKLRKLGYPFDSILRVTSKKKDNKYYLEVDVPDISSDGVMKIYPQQEAVKIMTNIVKLFGGENDSFIQEQMIEVYKFHTHIPLTIWESFYDNLTIQAFQAQFQSVVPMPFNWLDFLNEVTGPQIVMSQMDHLSFRRVSQLGSWIHAVFAANKRTTANYMIWKLIESQVKYLPKSIRQAMNISIHRERQQFCVDEIQERFYPYAATKVLNVRKLLPSNRRQKIKEKLADIKLDFLHLIEEAVWIDQKDKAIIKDKLNSVKIVFALSGDYYSDGILDNLVVEAGNTIEKGTFLGVLGQVNKNYQSQLYKRVVLPNITLEIPRLHLYQSLPMYYLKRNEIYIPIEFLYYIGEDKPEYFSYPRASLLYGSLFSTFLHGVDNDDFTHVQPMTEQTMEAKKDINECMVKQLRGPIVENDELATHLGINALYSGIYDKIGHQAFQTLLKKHGPQPKLPGFDSYTLQELVWLGNVYCMLPEENQYDDDKLLKQLSSVEFYKNATLAGKRNNPQFAEDFNCPKGSPMNPKSRCPLLL